MSLVANKIAQTKLGLLNQKVMSSYWTRTAMEATTAVALYHTTDRPDIVLGLIPFWGITAVETASSQNILKYRAVGGQYLAHQHGGNISLRIDMILKGPTVPLQLGLLDVLFSFGKTRNKVNGGILYQPFFKGNLTADTLTGQNLSSAQEGLQLIDPTDTDNAFSVAKDDFSWITSDYHNTFAIVTRDFVMTGMYVESFIYFRNVAKDPNMVRVSLLCRKFVPPPQVSSVANEDVKRDTVIDARKKFNLLPGQWEEVYGIPMKNAQAVIANQRYIGYENIYRSNVHEFVDAMISVLHQWNNNVLIGYRKDPYSVLRDRTTRDSGLVLNAVIQSASKHQLRAATKNLNKKQVVYSGNAETSIGIRLSREMMIEGRAVITLKDPDNAVILNSITVDIRRKEIYTEGSGRTIDVTYNGGLGTTIRFDNVSGSRRFVFRADMFAILDYGSYYIFQWGKDNKMTLYRYVGDVIYG